jgi:hypothetical protein
MLQKVNYLEDLVYSCSVLLLLKFHAGMKPATTAEAVTAPQEFSRQAERQYFSIYGCVVND